METITPGNDPTAKPIAHSKKSTPAEMAALSHEIGRATGVFAILCVCPDNVNVHRAAAKIIVPKSRAARGSVCNVLLSRGSCLPNAPPDVQCVIYATGVIKVHGHHNISGFRNRKAVESRNTVIVSALI